MAVANAAGTGGRSTTAEEASTCAGRQQDRARACTDPLWAPAVALRGVGGGGRSRGGAVESPQAGFGVWARFLHAVKKPAERRGNKVAGCGAADNLCLTHSHPLALTFSRSLSLLTRPPNIRNAVVPRRNSIAAFHRRLLPPPSTAACPAPDCRHLWRS